AFGVERWFIDGDRIDEPAVKRLGATGRFPVLERGGGLAGCVYVEARGDAGSFGLLSVRPGLQRVGLGRRLVAAAEAWCQAAGCRQVEIRIVDLRDELFDYYGALGYAEVGREPFSPEEAPRLKRP